MARDVLAENTILGILDSDGGEEAAADVPNLEDFRGAIATPLYP